MSINDQMRSDGERSGARMRMPMSISRQDGGDADVFFSLSADSTVPPEAAN